MVVHEINRPGSGLPKLREASVQTCAVIPPAPKLLWTDLYCTVINTVLVLPIWSDVVSYIGSIVVQNYL